VGSIPPINNGIKGFTEWAKQQVPSALWPTRIYDTLQTLRLDHDLTEKRLRELEEFQEDMSSRPF
jgi:hypothetical protein